MGAYFPADTSGKVNILLAAVNFLFLLIDWAPLIFKRDENWSADDVNTFFLNKDILALFYAYKEERGRFRDGGHC
ncbi:hypothetical protein OUZ56_023277 [Daphnia magna]|uniref:Uncharacterized protein n=1 Tax=Daphnia magna TaxID=35525 RepID=A0ABR0AYV5_9CRUS|nr:hypothetical protein OUZ56_023277 [Daphnia magna]